MIACSTSIGSDSSLESALSTIRALGFQSVDLLTIDGWVHVHLRDLVQQYDQTAARVDALLASSGLRAIATNSGTSVQLYDRSTAANEARRQELHALCRFLKERDIHIAAIQPLRKDESRPWEQVLADCVATLREQVAIGEQYGVQFALELHVWSPFETVEQARRLIEVFPEVPLVYDPTHFIMQGVDVRETGWIMDRARHVHARDAAKGKIQEHLGQGGVDFDWVCRELKDRGYRGHFSIEYLQDKTSDFREDARRLADLLRSHFPD